MKNVKAKRLISMLLLIAMLIGVIPTNRSFAAPNTKTMTIEFNEKLDGNNRSKKVIIPKLKNVVSVKSNTGTVTHSINGEEVTVNVKGGMPSRQVNNPKKYSKSVTDSSTSSNNSFSSTKSYNSGGYSGTLDKDGASKIISGSYTPAHSKSASDSRVSYGSNSNPSSVHYNSGGYSGSLSRTNTTSNTVQTGGSAPQNKYVTGHTSSYYNSGGYSGSLSQYVYSGSYTPAHSKTATTSRSGVYYEYKEKRWEPRGSVIDYEASGPSVPQAVFYNSNGYSGELKISGGSSSASTYVGPSITELTNMPIGTRYLYSYFTWYTDYSGTVTRPASDTRVYRYQGYVYTPDTRTYRTDYTSHYSGTVTKPAVDTRTWEQDYSGTVYKAGSDDYYSYSVEIEYIDNTDPTIEVSSPSNGVKRSGVSGYANLVVSGTTKDIDVGNKLTVKYKLSTGEAGSIANLIADASNQSFSKAVDVSSLPSGSHSIAVWTEDDQGGRSEEVSRSFIVDKEKPVISFNDYIKTPINQDITVKASVNKGMLNKESHTFTKNGSFEFIATDEVGNVGKRTVVIDNIDKVKPVITIEDYIKTPTNKDVVVKAKTDKGTLNKESHTFKENGSFEFIATDVAGNITRKTVSITNIDKVAPTIKLTPNITEATNQDVVINVEVADSGSGIDFIKLPDGREVKVDKVTFVVGTNGTYEFKVTDKAGNITTEEIKITNIDKVPVEITIDDYIKTPTNKDITVKASINKGTLNKTSHTFTENGTFKFTAEDEAGNKDQVTVTITNIDKVKPIITIEDYIKTPTNQDVLVKATVDKGKLNKESHTFKENGSFEFIATDVAGNITRKTVSITNIDKVKPVITIEDYVKTPINQDIVVKAKTNKGALNKESHTFKENGSFEFVATDKAGNITKEKVTITNIDKVPVVITIEDYIKTPTNKDITVKASVNKGTLNKTSHTFKENGTFKFTAEDVAGNKDQVTVTITNIDKVKPVITIEDYVKTPTNQDVVVKAKVDKGKLNKESHTFKENGNFEFIATDLAGNITKKKVTITNIDKVKPVITIEDYVKTPTNQDIVVKAKTDKGNLNKTSHTFKENGNFEFIATDVAGNVTKKVVNITNIDKVKPVITIKDYTKTPTNQDVVVKATVDKGKLNKESHTFKENGSFEFIATDLAGNVTREKVTIANIDKVVPELKLIVNTTKPTNQDVVITAEATDDASGIDSITLPGGEVIKVDKVTFVVEENGTYRFTTTDKAGNTKTEEIIISNIDKVPVVITIDDYIKAPTNKDITVKASVNKGALNKESHIFTNNGSFKFTAEDKAGNKDEVTVTITNIVKISPDVTFTPNGNINPEKSQSTKVGVEATSPAAVVSREYVWSQSEASPSDGWKAFKDSETLTQPNGDGNYFLYIKAVDNAGNTTITKSKAFNLDNTAPEKPVLKASTEADINKDVLVTITYSEDTNIKEYKLNSGKWEAYTKPVVVELNGIVSARGIDRAGNVSDVEKVVITNIDKVAPELTLTKDIEGPTNEDIKITAKATDDASGVESIALPDNKVINSDNASFTVEKNGTYSFTAKDKAGNTTTEEIKITNIDKTPPTKPEVCYINDEFVLTEGKDLESGIKKHLYSINNGQYKEWTKNLIASSFEDGAYDIKVKAVDKATNESEVSTLKVILRHQEAERKTSKAEDTLTREDYHIAKDVVDTLNPGDIKDDLLQRLKDVLHKIIKKEFEDLVDGSEGEEDLKDAEEQIKDSDLDQDVKDGLLEKLNNKAIELATRAVELAEAMRREPYIGNAIVLVDKITPCPEKTALEDRIAKIKEVREGQLGAIDSNEENYELKNAELDVKQAEALKREPFLTKAKVNVAHLPESEEKTVLEARLEALNQLLEGNSEEAIKGAERAVAQAEAIKRKANLNSAKAVVDRLKKSVEKDKFLTRLKAVEDYINNEDGKEEPEKPINSDTQIKRAEDAVKLAERFKRDAFINQARQAVERLKDSEEKTRFLERLDAIK